MLPGLTGDRVHMAERVQTVLRTSRRRRATSFHGLDMSKGADCVQVGQRAGQGRRSHILVHELYAARGNRSPLACQ